MRFLNATGALITRQSFYTKVLPPRLRNFYVNSTVNDIGVENMFYIRFAMGSTAINANNHGSLYSRIYIEFPTVDSNGNALFTSDLKGYTKTG